MRHVTMGPLGVAAPPAPPAVAGGKLPRQETKAGAVLDLFEAFTRLYRPPGEEDAARAAIEDIVRRSESLWPAGSVSTARDDAGNLLVRLPGTGRFANLAKPVVLQAHMDMVLAVEGAKPGEDLRPYFRQGVKTELVTVDGEQWIRSLGSRTSLGADNALGMAVAARYITDPSIEHPPLELVFTTREEVGLVGARQMRLPLAGRVLFNFDSPGARTITRGCMGSSGAFMGGLAPTAPPD
ncbi:MAG TPA: hypothetical protein VLC93_12740, partial [Myxococcota bacterium]|nr:hypothetical protein [Myxococcota bacterium]